MQVALLSGGAQQPVAIARALVNRPPIISPTIISPTIEPAVCCRAISDTEQAWVRQEQMVHRPGYLLPECEAL
ncbi:MAG: hypothetical protein GZ089_01650 [Aromatoleum sp.]|nr:hypothetical protein [Aromatoleum sp.]